MSAKLTPLFGPDTKPVRKGVYQTDFPPFEDQPGYSNWTGTHWAHQFASVEEAANKLTYGEQSKHWRGLTSDPSKEAA
jgi:hypothetical protein